MYLTHYDDKKERYRSHEITLNFKGSGEVYRSELNDYYSINPFDNIGYGATKEEAYEDFKKKFLLSLQRLNDWCNVSLKSDMAYKSIAERGFLIFD